MGVSCGDTRLQQRDDLDTAEMRRPAVRRHIMKTSIKFIAPALGAAAIGAAMLLAPIASADTNPLVPYGTDPQVPNLGYYESNSGINSAGDTTLGSLDLPF
jgi:hypothetical protein